MKVKLNLDAFPRTEYGCLIGKVTSISQDLKLKQDNEYGYYLVEASVQKDRLTDKSGKAVELKAGMSGQAKIVVGEKSILRYALEKMNLWASS